MFCHTYIVVIKALVEYLGLRFRAVYENFSDIVNQAELVTTIVERDLSQYADQSLPVHTCRNLFVPPRAEVLPIAQRLKYIFNWEAWILFVVSLLSAITAWWVCLVDYDGRYAASNFIEAFSSMMSLLFGLGITRIPKKKVVKCFLMIYIFYCIHMQTALTANIFTLLSVPRSEETIKTPEDLVNSKMPICAVEGYRPVLVAEPSGNTRYSKIKRKIIFFPLRKPYPTERALVGVSNAIIRLQYL
ncbi:uncharacterized protein LOC116181346 [Photinus pyralis]|nr:uncharacterized protein LOC116181346 [Photinus pyralis]